MPHPAFWLAWFIRPPNVVEGEGQVIFVTETELPDGQDSSFGVPTPEDLTLRFHSDPRQKLFVSGEFPMSKYDGHIKKQPFEQFNVEHDFGPDLRDGEVINTISSILIEDLADGADVTALMLTDITSVDGTVVTYGLKGGVDGEEYKVTIKVATDESIGTAEGGTREVEHLVTVRDR